MVVGVIVMAAAGSAWAQSDKGDAEALFREGKRLMGARQTAAACEAFEGSYRKDPVLSTLLNLANCREENHQYATAWGLFVEAARLSNDQPALQQVARDRAAELEWDISFLIINVPDDSRVEGLTITRNGQPVDVAEWNRDMPVDGGTYVIAGKAPGHEGWSTTVTVGESKDKQSVSVPRFQPVRSPLAGATDERASWFTGRRKFAVGVWATAALDLGLAVSLEISARSAYDTAKAATDNATRHTYYDTANRRRLVATIAAGTGVALVGVGALLWINGKPARSHAVAVVPVVDDRWAGLAVSGAW